MKRNNSHKRIYIKGGLYFITTNIDAPFNFFKEHLFCELFVADLNLCIQIKEFSIYGYKVNPDHVHLLIQPAGECNYSEIMRSLKTNFSRNANYILGYNNTLGISKNGFSKARSRDLAFEKQMDSASMKSIEKHFRYIHRLKEEYETGTAQKYSTKFEWQSSFHFHVITSKADYYKHLNYIKKQWIKHELTENSYCFISKVKPDLSYTKRLLSL